MERKKLLFIASVSASVLLASSLLVACTSEDAIISGISEPPRSTTQVQSVSASRSESEVSSSTPSSSAAESRSAPSRSQSSRPPVSSSRAAAASSSRAEPVQQAQPQQAPPAQTPQPTAEVQAPPAPPPPAPEQPAPPPPAPTVDAGVCIAEARAYALGKGITEDGSLNTGNSGYLNPPDISTLSQDSVIADLKYCIDVYAGYSPDDPSLVHFNIVQSGNLIYVLYQ